MKSKPVGVTSASINSGRAYLKLKEMIYRGQLHPGQRLVENKLARKMSMSRIPMRECLIRLESEGLVRSVANTATFVEDFSPQDLLEINSMRLVLEPLAARLAAFRTTSALVHSLHRLCEQMTLAAQGDDWVHLDRVDYEFHWTIVRASQHGRLIRAYEMSHIRIVGRRADYIHLKELPADTTAREHLQIVTCIENGDAVGAERANYEHVEKAMRLFELPFGVHKKR